MDKKHLERKMWIEYFFKFCVVNKMAFVNKKHEISVKACLLCGENEYFYGQTKYIL